MNIKSELLSKKLKWFPTISIHTLLATIIIAIVLSMLILFVEQGLFFKLIFIVVSSGITLVYTYDNKRDDEGEKRALRTGFGLILTTLLFVEIPLYVVSKTKEITQVTNIIEPYSKKGEKIDASCEENCKYTQINYEQITIYNIENNNKLGYRKMNGMDDPRKKLWENINSRETYYHYIPFIEFESDFRYIRNTDKQGE